MARITLTADEEFMYLDKLDKIRELIPELEVLIHPQAAPLNVVKAGGTDLGEEFRQFIKATATTIDPRLLPSA